MLDKSLSLRASSGNDSNASFSVFNSSALVQTHVDAYILTLFSQSTVLASRKRGLPYRSTQEPGTLTLALRALKPCFSKTVVYHGLRPADRSSTRPPSLRATLSALTCVSASEAPGENQSMLSMIWLNRSATSNENSRDDSDGLLTTAMVNVPGDMRFNVSLTQSVWMRKPSKAPGRDSFV